MSKRQIRMRVKLTKSSCRFLLAWGFTSIWDARRMADLVMCWTLSMAEVRFWQAALRAAQRTEGSDCRAFSGVPVNGGCDFSFSSLPCFFSEDCGKSERKVRKVRLSLTLHSTPPCLGLCHALLGWRLASTFRYQDMQFRDK